MARSVPVYDAAEKDTPRFTWKARLRGAIIPPCQSRSKVRAVGWCHFPLSLVILSALKPPRATYKKVYVMWSAFLVPHGKLQGPEESVLEPAVLPYACGETASRSNYTKFSLVRGQWRTWVSKRIHTSQKLLLHRCGPTPQTEWKGKSLRVHFRSSSVCHTYNNGIKTLGKP